MLNCLIVDDELIARKGIERYVEKIPFLKCIGSVRTAIDAVQFLDKTDLMIIDIQMPQITGIDFLKARTDAPVTIIFTAYPEHALQGFELGVIDYIVKPSPFERFLKACTKAKEYIELRRRDSKANEDYFFIRCDRKIEKILFREILFIEAKENYSCIHTTIGNFMPLMSIGSIAEHVDPKQFVRVHKSFIVSLAGITKVEANNVWVGPHKIPVSRRMKAELKRLLLKSV